MYVFMRRARVGLPNSCCAEMRAADSRPYDLNDGCLPWADRVVRPYQSLVLYRKIVAAHKDKGILIKVFLYAVGFPQHGLKGIRCGAELNLSHRIGDVLQFSDGLDIHNTAETDLPQGAEHLLPFNTAVARK